jgi:tetratricopeptide (TPR) repeat protein
MIVKNEEKLLPKCLKSIRDYVDEIVVVDTGSTDSTVAIAESFGACVYYHPWEHNFSKHRNQSFGYATGDWIFIVDADEELLPGSGEELRRSISTDDDCDAIAVVVESPFEQSKAKAQGSSIRVVRNDTRIRYEGRVHNYLVGVEKARRAPINILHHGYNLNKEASNRKFKRTTELLKREIQENPSNPRPHHFLSASYLSESMFREAAEEAENAIALYEKQNTEPHNYLWSLYIASHAHFDMGDIRKAAEFARKGAETSPYHLDSHYMLAMVAYVDKNRAAFQESMAHYLEAKSLFEKDPGRFGEMVHNTFESQWLLHLFGAVLFLDEADAVRAEEELEKSRTRCPDMFLYHTKLGTAFRLSGRMAQAAEQFLKALELKPEDTGTMWVLSFVYEQLGRAADQINWLEKLILLDTEFLGARFTLGLAHMRLGDFERALSLFRDVSSLDSGNTRAKVNQVICLRGLQRYEESIQLSQQIESATKSEQMAIVSNLAHCYYESGQLDLARDSFQKLADLDHTALDPPVFLSRLFLDANDVEACVTQCDRLLSILGIEGDIVLEGLADLGEQYFKVGKALLLSGNPSNLGRICFDMCIMLGCSRPETIAEMGVALIQANDPVEGTQFLSKALSMAPQNEKVKAAVMDATKTLEGTSSGRLDELHA